MRLWQKIALLNIVIIITMSMLTAFIIRSITINAMRSEGLIQGESIATNLSDRISELLLYEDYYNASEVISEFINKERDLRYIFITDLNGKLFAHTFKEGHPKEMLNWNPIAKDSTKSVQLLNTEEGNITDIAVRIFAGMPAELHIGIKEDRMIKTLNSIRNYMILLTASVIIAGALLSFVLSRMITKPLEQLNEFTDNLSRGDFGRQVQISSRDEVGRLADTFNNLSKELLLYKERTEESYKQMLRTEKLTALGRLSGGLAHEIKNPLMPIKTLFQAFRDNPQITRQDVDIVLSSVEQIDDVVTKFIGFARNDTLNYSDIYVNAIIKDILELIEFQIKEQGISLQIELSKTPPLSGDRPMLKQAIFNILLNAVEAMPEGGKLRVQTSQRGEYIIIDISDTGIGIPAEIQEKIFDPFFTTKKDGTGLGLSISYNIIRMHKGQLQCKSDVGETTFSITLPAANKT